MIAKLPDLIEIIEGLFNEKDDDEARVRIFGTTCVEIARFPTDEVASMLEAALDGPTGDDDERAIIRLIECIPCERITGEIWPVFGTLLTHYA